MGSYLKLAPFNMSRKCSDGILKSGYVFSPKTKMAQVSCPFVVDMKYFTLLSTLFGRAHVALETPFR